MRARSMLAPARRVLMAAVLAAILLGIGDRDAPRATRLPELDVLVVVDRTTSMSALDDPTGSRITAARRDLVDLAGRLESARFTLVAVGRDAQVVLPPTSDRIAFDDVLTRLQVEAPEAGRGSSPARAVPAVEQLLSGGHGGRRQVLVYAGDGEDTDEADDTSDPDGTGATPFAGVRGQLQGGVVLGYGTEDGGVMPLRPADPDRPPPSPAEAAEAGGLVPDVRTGGPAVSHASPTNLEEIADQIDASFVRADGHQDMGAVARAVQRQAYAGLEPVRASRQVSWLWGLLLLVLVAPDLRHGWRRWLQARREVAR